MDKKSIAKFKIADSFSITGRGLVFAGEIVDGQIDIGDLIEFTFSGQTRLRKIKDIGLIRRSDNIENCVGLVLSCVDQNEINELKGHFAINQIAFIFKADT